VQRWIGQLSYREPKEYLPCDSEGEDDGQICEKALVLELGSDKCCRECLEGDEAALWAQANEILYGSWEDEERLRAVVDDLNVEELDDL
jgi:hypothetical protein